MKVSTTNYNSNELSSSSVHLIIMSKFNIQHLFHQAMGVNSLQPTEYNMQRKELFRNARRQMHIDSSQVEEALNPVKGVRDALKRRGIEPRNHSKQNIKEVKRMSELNALRKQQEACQVETITIKQRFRATDRSRRSGKVITDEDARNNYVLRNIAEVGTKSLPLSSANAPKESVLWTNKHCYGKVPSYLQFRKMELLKERQTREKAKEAALCPEGMRIMSDEERSEALNKIISNKTNVETKLHNLPLIIETPSLMNIKSSLERRLTELEEAEKIFSRPKVIIKT